MTQDESWYEKTHSQLCLKDDGGGPNHSSPPCNFDNVRVDTSYINSCYRNDIQVRMQVIHQGSEYSWDQQGPSSSLRSSSFPIFLCAGLRSQPVLQWWYLAETSFPSGNHIKYLCVCVRLCIYASMLFQSDNINTKRPQVSHFGFIFNKPSDSNDINKSE